jgi:hypothetical protein
VQISHRKTPNDHTSAFIHFSLVACIARQKRYKQRPRHVRACACAVVRVRVRVLYLWRRAGGVHGHHLGRHPLWADDNQNKGCVKAAQDMKITYPHVGADLAHPKVREHSPHAVRDHHARG